MNRPIHLTAVLALLATSPALADTPTPPERPVNAWEFIGKYPNGIGAGGLEYLNAVIKRDAIHRRGHIVEVYIGRDFTKIEGLWVPSGVASAVGSYEIDCKYHTYHERWYEWAAGSDAGVRQTMPYQWITITADSYVALAEKRVCKSPT